MDDEKTALVPVRDKSIRIIGTQRKRKLQRRGESVWWSQILDAWVWRPKTKE